VKICSLYGAGFYYIPGTDTCLKLGGWVRAEYNINSGGSFNFTKVTANTRDSGANTIRVRGILTVDTRTQTEYGTLRSYIAGGFQHTTGGAAGVTTSEYVAPTLYSPRAFVQLAGFTAGLAQSFYDFFSTPSYSNTTNVWGADSGGSGDIVAGYTAQFGNGMSASIALEDPVFRRTAITNGAGGAYFVGPEIPDVVANLRIDQAWGSAQIMGGLHQVESTYYVAGVPGSGHPKDVWGGAIGAGAKFNLPMLGKGDSVAFEVDWAQGALKYLGSGIATIAIAHGSSIGIGNVFDAIYTGTIPAGTATSLQLTKGWSAVGGYEHNWNMNWKTSLYGAYGHIDYPTGAASTAVFGAAINPDFSFYQISSRTTWTPVANLDLSLEVMYNKLISETVTAAPLVRDQSVWQAIVRVQRNFWP